MAKQKTKSGEWLHPAEPVKIVTTPRRNNILSQESDNLTPVPETPRTIIRDTDPDSVRIAKKGGHERLLDFVPHKPTTSPKKVNKDGGDWYYQDKENNNEPPQTPRSKVKATDTEYLKCAKTGGRKDLLEIKEHQPKEKPVEFKLESESWYKHHSKPEETLVTPRSRVKATDTAYIKKAKENGDKALLTIKEHQPTKSRAYYNKTSGGFLVDDRVDAKETFKRDTSTPDSARVHRNCNRRQHNPNDTEYLRKAKAGGHRDLLKTPDNTRYTTPRKQPQRCGWFYLEENKAPPQRPRSAVRRSNTMDSSLFSSRQAERRPQTSYSCPRPVYIGGDGPQVRNNYARRSIRMGSGCSPFALHDSSGSSMTSRNPDKI